MNDAIVLDTGPLGLLTNPSHSALPVAIRRWVVNLLAAGRRVILPELSDYELRRELIRGNMSQSLVMLDALSSQIEYVPLDTAMMRKAAELWAQARQAGLPTAPDPALDGDVILAAQTLSLGANVIVATGNPIHLARFVPAADWHAITP